MVGDESKQHQMTASFVWVSVLTFPEYFDVHVVPILDWCHTKYF